jgi:hypothetical protein
MSAAVIAASHNQGWSSAPDVSSVRNACKAFFVGGTAARYPSMNSTARLSSRRSPGRCRFGFGAARTARATSRIGRSRLAGWLEVGGEDSLEAVQFAHERRHCERPHETALSGRTTRMTPTGSDLYPSPLYQLVLLQRVSQFPTERTEQAVWGQSEFEEQSSVRGVVEVDSVGQALSQRFGMVGAIRTADDPEGVGLRDNGHGASFQTTSTVGAAVAVPVPIKTG